MALPTLFVPAKSPSLMPNSIQNYLEFRPWMAYLIPSSSNLWTSYLSPSRRPLQITSTSSLNTHLTVSILIYLVFSRILTVTFVPTHFVCFCLLRDFPTTSFISWLIHRHAELFFPTLSTASHLASTYSTWTAISILLPLSTNHLLLPVAFRFTLHSFHTRRSWWVRNILIIVFWSVLTSCSFYPHPAFLPFSCFIDTDLSPLTPVSLFTLPCHIPMSFRVPQLIFLHNHGISLVNLIVLSQFAVSHPSDFWFRLLFYLLSCLSRWVKAYLAFG